MFERRRVIVGLFSGIAMVASWRPISALAKGAGRAMPIAYPPFELQARKEVLASLATGIAGFKIEAIGKSVRGVWLCDTRGQSWLVEVDQRDVRPLFEVFTLGILSRNELHRRWRKWKAPIIAADVPERFRQLMTTRPPEPVAPTDFEPWPFQANRIDVLRRAEFVVEGIRAAGSFGDAPNSQSADRPGHVPDEAIASCEVAAGLLFTGDRGQRLLIGVNWTPMNIVFTQDSAAIDAYLTVCEPVALSAYLSRI